MEGIAEPSLRESRRPRLDRPPTEEQHAKELLGAPREWQWSMMRREGDWPNCWGVTIEGGVCPPKTRGPNKGRPNWRKATHKRVITLTDEMHRAWLRAWEAAERKCWVCWGTGERWTSWSVATGDSYEPCKRCGASGLPPASTGNRKDGSTPNPLETPHDR